MSYILEALKKSQQERNRGQVPDIETLHPGFSMPESLAPRWPYWALGVCLLALAFLLGWLRPWIDVEEPLHQATVLQRPEPEKIVPGKVDAPVRRQLTEQPVVVSVRSAEPVPAVSSLVQQSIPPMKFAGHVYSSNPQQRSVIINGRFLSEGDELMSGMKLVGITMDSVIFSYQGQQFRVTVLHDWSFK
jgi:general secretion pathway protein B